VNVGGRLRGRVLALERPPAREELERDDREGVLVARRADPLALGLLGREVTGCPQDRSRPGERIEAGGAGDPEVGHVHLPALVDEQVRRLHVSVHDPRLMRRVERGSRLLQPCQRFARRLGPRRTTSSSDPPDRYSITMNGRPFHSPTSKIVTMWASLESRAARAPRA
jgi:hypothetical protein